MPAAIPRLSGIGKAGGVLATCIVMGVLLHLDLGFMLSHGPVPPAADHAHVPLHLIGLRRESVPVVRNGEVVSYRTSYSGVVSVGSPRPQEFRVVFDTGSGHVVLPSLQCESETCLKKHRYDIEDSDTAVPVNSDGSVAEPDAPRDHVTIGFGTGQVTGELVRERVCLGAAQPHHESGAGLPLHGSCVSVNAVVALELSPNPFGLLPFDGILGLGLRGLSLTRNFSFFDALSESGQLEHARFGVFLAEGESGDESELAVGGHNPERLLSPLAWASVARPELGYWQVQILAFHIGDHTMDFCRDGSCRGIIDTGTSHLGVPAPYDKSVAELLKIPAGDLLDCREADAPVIKIELRGFNLTLNSENYMRRLPLQEDVFSGMNQGVVHPSYNQTTITTTPLHYLRGEAGSDAAEGDDTTARFCRPRLMPVRMPPPVGPKLFILGEPVLHRYYTVFDWAVPQIGFGLAAGGREAVRSAAAGRPGSPLGEPDVYLMQRKCSVCHSS